ncbi:MAG: peptide deformylase [bacterium]|nr:peptide deformylase [bacterium]
MLLPVLVNPHPLLRERAQEVDAATLERLKREGFVENLVETMRVKDGVGIAAIQVGQLHRIIVVQEGTKTRVYINPVITGHSIRKETDTEGCLSVPGKFGLVRRPKTCTIRALDLDGNPIVRKAKGLVARIYQHEVDHLNGILFVDKAEHVMDYDPEQDTPNV